LHQKKQDAAAPGSAKLNEAMAGFLFNALFFKVLRQFQNVTEKYQSEFASLFLVQVVLHNFV